MRNVRGVQFFWRGGDQVVEDRSGELESERKKRFLYFSRDSFQASAVQKQSDVVHWTMKEAQQVLDL